MRHLAALPFLLAAATAQAAPLAAHHAVYALTLDTAKTQTVMAAHGSMTYDVTDTCGAWTTSQHLVIDLTNQDGQDVHMVSDYATLEAKDGTHLDFHSKQVTDTAVTEQVDGTATLTHAGGSGHADFTSPQKTTLLLPDGTLLPMAHTNALIDAAAAGQKFLSVPLFDGTGLRNWHDLLCQRGGGPARDELRRIPDERPPGATGPAAAGTLLSACHNCYRRQNNHCVIVTL